MKITRNSLYVLSLLGILAIWALPSCYQLDGQSKMAFPVVTSTAQMEELLPKIEGVSVVGTRQPVGNEAFAAIKDMGAEWVALLPYGFGNQGSPELHWNLSRQWWGETKKGLYDEAKMLRQHQLKVMVKPQIWFHHGMYTGDFSLTTEEEWKEWEKNYEAFIMDYAHLADSIRAEMFCIGTELKNFVQERPGFWYNLIGKVRKVYSGALTYAGNWDNYTRIPFYSQLDFIGVDAYFPISEARTPSVKELENAWKPYISEMEKVVIKHRKPVIFTEFGYKSVDFALAKPWEHRSSETVNLTAQQNGYEALFKVFYAKPWFQGGFLWNWYPNHTAAGGKENKDFTPQNKPAQETTRKWFNSQQ